MAKHKEEKTNVVRILEAAGIPCTAYEVPLEKGQVPDGVTAARLIGKPPEQVFKTLVAEGPKGEHFVFVIPVAETLDLKKAARAAGMKEIIAIIDVSGLSRSKIASKQLAHNAISGFDDPSILREICKMLDDVDDMLESYIGKDIMEEPLEQYDKLLSPAVHFDFKNNTFSFLPHQVKDMDALVKNLESSAPEIIGVAPYEQCKQFIEALARYQKFSDIRNVGAAIHSMIESVTEKMDEVGFKDDEEWTYLTKIFGSNAIPAESAATITKAIKKAEKDGAITSKNRWQLIEMLATE